MHRMDSWVLCLWLASQPKVCYQHTAYSEDCHYAVFTSFCVSYALSWIHLSLWGYRTHVKCLLQYGMESLSHLHAKKWRAIFSPSLFSWRNKRAELNFVDEKEKRNGYAMHNKVFKEPSGQRNIKVVLVFDLDLLLLNYWSEKCWSCFLIGVHYSQNSPNKLHWAVSINRACYAVLATWEIGGVAHLHG